MPDGLFQWLSRRDELRADLPRWHIRHRKPLGATDLGGHCLCELCRWLLFCGRRFKLHILLGWLLQRGFRRRFLHSMRSRHLWDGARRFKRDDRLLSLRGGNLQLTHGPVDRCLSRLPLRYCFGLTRRRKQGRVRQLCRRLLCHHWFHSVQPLPSWHLFCLLRSRSLHSLPAQYLQPARWQHKRDCVSRLSRWHLHGHRGLLRGHGLCGWHLLLPFWYAVGSRWQCPAKVAR